MQINSDPTLARLLAGVQADARPKAKPHAKFEPLEPPRAKPAFAREAPTAGARTKIATPGQVLNLLV